MRSTFPGREPLAWTLLFPLFLAACGDDGTGPGDELTGAEAAVMMEALFEAGGFGLSEAGSSGPVETTEPCPGGGSVDVEGTSVLDLGAGTVTWTVTQVHRSCVVTVSDGSVWTFDGAPDVEVDFLVSFGGASIELDGTQAGTVEWSQGGRSGTCAFDVTYDLVLSGDFSTVTGSAAGTACGHAYEEPVG